MTDHWLDRANAVPPDPRRCEHGKLPDDYCQQCEGEPAAPAAPRTAGWDLANPDNFGKVAAAPAAPEQPSAARKLVE